MIAYLVIFILCGVIVAQGFVYYLERVKLYKHFEKNTPHFAKKGKEKKNVIHGHKRALIKWRNGGEDN